MATRAPPDLAHEPLTDPDRPQAAGWLARLGRFSAKRRRPVLMVWFILTVVAAPLALSLTSTLSGAGWDPQGTVAAEVRDELRTDFAALGAEAAMVVYRQDAPIADDPSGLPALIAELDGAPGAVSVVDTLSMPPEAGLIAQDGRTALVSVALEVDEDADLPKSAHDLIDHVDRLSLPAGAEAPSSVTSGSGPGGSRPGSTTGRPLLKFDY